MGGEEEIGVLNINLPIFSPEQTLKPIPLLRKTTKLPFVTKYMSQL